MMAAMPLPLPCWLSVCPVAVDPLLFAFRESTLPGKLILLVCLFVGSIFSWSVMVTKIRVLQYARRRTEDFLEQFRADRQPLRHLRGRARNTTARRCSRSTTPVARK